MSRKQSNAPDEAIPLPVNVPQTDAPEGAGDEKDPLRTVERHVEALGVEDWAYRGLKTAQQWPVGQRLRESKFKQLLDEWVNGPTDRRKK